MNHATGAGQGASGIPSSLSSYKRPRDYGEQLKGLLPSDDEDNQDGTSLPSLKKLRTTLPDDDSDSGLDDGEIVESSPTPGPASPAQHQSTTANRGASAHEPSTDGEIDATMDEPQESTRPNGPFFIDKAGTRPVQHTGWNQGLSLGARTSFGRPAAHLFPHDTSASTEAELASSRQSHADEDDDKETQEPLKPKVSNPTFSTGGNTWKLPSVTFRATKGSVTPGSWREKLRTWTAALIQENTGMVDLVTTEVVRIGFNAHLQHEDWKLIDDPNNVAEETRVQTAKEAAQKNIESDNLERLVSKLRRRYSSQGSQKANDQAKEEKSVSSNGPTREAPDEDEDEELQQQRRYFPGAENPSQCCLFCSGVGHRARECPQRHCRFCGSQDHESFGCPSKERCSKCHQLGHNGAACHEKLALALEEQGGCAFCGAEHTEERCSDIWRSYTPSSEVHKVKDIPAFCYTCGGRGHYGPECGLPDRGGPVTGTTTWSEANRVLYIDQDSHDAAIAWIDVDLDGSHVGNFHILGRAKRQVHTHFISSDDSEEDLVHAPIKKQEPRGEIRIASNIGSLGRGGNRGRARRNNDQSRRRENEREFTPPPPPSARFAQSNGNSSRQPPLPPGPPPPPRRTGFQGSLPSAPTSLPPRPQSLNQSNNRGAPNGGRGGQSSRGSRGGRGRGGRGGGRGRGRGNGA
ncbi:hypothetical protein GGS26DRAFT_143680 [Hypomontagnella submonticulosa]|nr:hypothetical protein GGS26DRAFT_143680 [Hypomontagnella submonticulosa]